MIYFVSDLHFGHDNIREFEAPTRSHWDSVEEMNEGLIELWNNTITNNDIVYNIGDFFFNMKPTKVEEILSKLNYKEMILIAGNHDHKKLIKIYERNGITVKYADMVKKDGKRFYLSHYPTLIGRKNMFNIHGHIHSQLMDTDYHINVGYDVEGKIAYSFDDIISRAGEYNGEIKK